jgi:hypothetical protein
VKRAYGGSRFLLTKVGYPRTLIDYDDRNGLFKWKEDKKHVQRMLSRRDEMVSRKATLEIIKQESY